MTHDSRILRNPENWPQLSIKVPVCGNQLFLECIHAVNAAFKATCYSVVCQPIYIGLDSAFTSQATGTRPEEHRDSHDRNAINLWPRLIFAKSSPSQPSVARTAIASYYFIFAHACLASDRVALWIIPLNAVATEPPHRLSFLPDRFTPVKLHVVTHILLPTTWTLLSENRQGFRNLRFIQLCNHRTFIR